MYVCMYVCITQAQKGTCWHIVVWGHMYSSMRTSDIYQYEDDRYITVLGHIYCSVRTHIVDIRDLWSCQGAVRHLLSANGADTHCSVHPDDCIPNQSSYYHQQVWQQQVRVVCLWVGGWGLSLTDPPPMHEGKCRNSEFGTSQCMHMFCSGAH